MTLSRVMLATALALVPVSLHAQWLNYSPAGVPRLPDGRPNLAAPSPKTADGRPDLSGVWEADRTGGSGLSFTGAPLPPLFTNIGAQLQEGLPYTAWARNLVNARVAENSKDSPDARCLPIGILWQHSHLSPYKILQLPGQLVILYERFTHFRQIFTDGRPLPSDPEPSFFGYSTGTWEGDSLVVRTIGFRDDLWADLSGSPLTESAKVTERFRRPTYGNLEIEITVDDPKAYTAPWSVKLNQVIRVEGDLLEFICEGEEENRRHVVGN